MKTKSIRVCIKGISALLMNRFNNSQIDTDTKKRSGAIEKSDIVNKLYLVDGKPQLPGVYFRNSLVEASKQFKITGKGKSTYSKLVGSTVEIQEEYCEIKGDYIPYTIAAVNPMTKGRMMVTRPRFNQWETQFTLILNDEGTPVSVINEILEYAGHYVGVGDWRPQTKGMFGKFMLTSFQEVR